MTTCKQSNEAGRLDDEGPEITALMSHKVHSFLLPYYKNCSHHTLYEQPLLFHFFPLIVQLQYLNQEKKWPGYSEKYFPFFFSSNDSFLLLQYRSSQRINHYLYNITNKKSKSTYL